MNMRGHVDERREICSLQASKYQEYWNIATAEYR
jgi:hypothetical protein